MDPILDPVLPAGFDYYHNNIPKTKIIAKFEVYDTDSSAGEVWLLNIYNALKSILILIITNTHVTGYLQPYINEQRKSCICNIRYLVPPLASPSCENKCNQGEPRSGVTGERD